MKKEMGEWKDEIKLHFDAVAENVRSDFRGASKDKLQQHEERIVGLENVAGLSGGRA